MKATSMRELIAAGLDESSEAPAPLALGEEGHGDIESTGPGPMPLDALEGGGLGTEEAPPPAPLDQIGLTGGSEDATLAPPPSELEVGGVEQPASEALGAAQAPPPTEGPDEIVGAGALLVATEAEPPGPKPLDELERLESKR